MCRTRNPFWIFVERAVLHGVISGYSTSPPCVPGGAPCFLWANNLTRNQAAKIVASHLLSQLPDACGSAVRAVGILARPRAGRPGLGRSS